MSFKAQKLVRASECGGGVVQIWGGRSSPNSEGAFFDDSNRRDEKCGARTLARCVSRSQNLCESSIFESKCTTVVTFVAGFATVTRIPKILEPEP